MTKLLHAESDTEHIFKLMPCWALDANIEQRRVIGKLIENMVLVVGGTFSMEVMLEQEDVTDENRIQNQDVKLKNYYIGKYQVTQEEWMSVMGCNPSENVGNNNPVECIEWNDCQEFIKKLRQLTGLNFDCPTELQWEFAARGGNNSSGYKYSGSNYIEEVAWFEGNSEGVTHEVGQKLPNELGIYDMSGNVSEWCRCGESDDASQVYRGGSVLDSDSFCRLSFRQECAPDVCYTDLGLRLVINE